MGRCDESVKKSLKWHVKKSSQWQRRCVSVRNAESHTRFFTSTAQRICAINTSRDKNSCSSFAKLSAWCVPSARFFFCIIAFLIVALTFLLPYATPRATLDFFTSTAQRICAINTGRDKNSCRSFAKLSAWCVPLARFFFLNIALTFLLPYATLRATLDFFTYAQRICAINTGKDKNSCRSFAKLSAWCACLWHAFSFVIVESFATNAHCKSQ